MIFGLGASWSSPSGMWLKPSIDLDNDDFESIAAEYGLVDNRLSSVYHRGRVLEAYATIILIEFLAAHGAANAEEAALRVAKQLKVIQSYAVNGGTVHGDDV